MFLRLDLQNSDLFRISLKVKENQKNLIYAEVPEEY